MENISHFYSFWCLFSAFGLTSLFARNHFQLPQNNNSGCRTMCDEYLQKGKYVKFLRSLAMWSAAQAHAACIFQTLSLALALTHFNENACLCVLSCQFSLFVELPYIQSRSIAWTAEHVPMNQPREEKKKSRISSDKK